MAKTNTVIKTQNNALTTVPARKANAVVTAPNFSLNAAVKAVEALRVAAGTHNTQYEVAGRNSMLNLMQRVYVQFHAAKHSSSYDAFMGNIRASLKNMGDAPRKNSPDTSSLVRFVFADFTDKQVHVYGRSLQVAMEDSLAPADYIAFINESCGFEGVRKAASSKTTAKKHTPDIALSYAKLEPTVKTVEVDDWKDANENFRVFIAIRDDDEDTAALKDAKLTDERLKAAILMYYTNKRELEATPKRKATVATKTVEAKATLEVANAEVEKDNIESNLQQAIAANDDALCEELRAELDWATAKVAGLTKSAKEFKASSKA